MSVLNTAVSGMLADSNWLSTIAQNVSNANTTGYKNTETEFSSLVDSAPGQTPQVAGVTTQMVSYNTMQGQVESTQTVTNLAVQGAGFFVVSDGSGNTFLTRNGSFTPDAQGNLVNSAGYYLMAAPTTTSYCRYAVRQLRVVFAKSQRRRRRGESGPVHGGLADAQSALDCCNYTRRKPAFDQRSGVAIYRRDDHHGVRQSRRRAYAQCLFRQYGRRQLGSRCL